MPTMILAYTVKTRISSPRLPASRISALRIPAPRIPSHHSFLHFNSNTVKPPIPCPHTVPFCFPQEALYSFFFTVIRLRGGGGGVQAYHFGKKYFKLGVGGEGQNMSRHVMPRSKNWCKNQNLKYSKYSVVIVTIRFV